MSGWAQRRFWTSARVEASSVGFEVRLDDRPVRTPSKEPLVLPTKPLAEAVAAEWDNQQDVVVPDSMTFTRMANSAVDKVSPRRDEVIAHIASYGGTDLLCYRAQHPEELSTRQASAWDVWLDWAAERYGARLLPTAGIVPVTQPDASLARLAEALQSYSPFELAAVHDLVGLSGSLVLGLAAAEGAADPSELWDLSRLDEIWQIEQWGADEEASKVNDLKMRTFLDAHVFFCLAQKTG